MIESSATFLLWVAALSWIGFLFVRGCWWTREILEVSDGDPATGKRLEEITVVIPARNEADVIRPALESIIKQGADLNIIVIDDRSEDRTAERVGAVGNSHVQLIPGAALPSGWSGKLWALEQGRQRVTTRYVLFVDADIELAPGIVKALHEKMRREKLSLLSLMAVPMMVSIWDKLFMPAFVFFFQALYPFHRVNSTAARCAAAAGGCMLVDSRALAAIDGFAPMKSAIIDDCTLARRIKQRGFKVWLGLTHSVSSLRSYRGPGEIGNMIARCAFTQLDYSPARLALCSFLMLLLYALPVFGLFSAKGAMRYLPVACLTIMFSTYLPTLRFYRRSPLWVFCLPFTALFFLAMTWLSAVRYWHGERTRWKGRIYSRDAALMPSEYRFR